MKLGVLGLLFISVDTFVAFVGLIAYLMLLATLTHPAVAVTFALIFNADLFYDARTFRLRQQPLCRTWASNSQTLHGLVGPEKVNCPSLLFLPAHHPKMLEFLRDRGKKVRHSVCRNYSSARKLMVPEPKKPNMAKGYLVGKHLSLKGLMIDGLQR